MKPFEQLTKRGQARRLRSLAINALGHYDLDISHIQLLGMFEHVTGWHLESILQRCSLGYGYVSHPILPT